MKVLVFGSANIDRTYHVDHFVAAGETMSADYMESFCGGKGFNQAVAFARAGSEVYFAGAVGSDGDALVRTLKENGIHTDYLLKLDAPSGHAIIQVAPNGQNCIIILAGTNGMITPETIDHVLENFSAGDLIVLQNEISNVGYIITQAKAKGMTVALNPSPFNALVKEYDLTKVDYLLLNEVEGASLTDCGDLEKVADAVRAKYPNANVVLTLGSLGSEFLGTDGQHLRAGIYRTTAVDTTAAGDTYTGFFMAEALATGDIKTALRNAAIASGISVSRPGASTSIPSIEEVKKADKEAVSVVFAG